MLLLGLATPFTTVLPSLRGLELHISWGEYGSGGGNEQLMILLGKEKDDQKVGRSVGRANALEESHFCSVGGVSLLLHTHDPLR